MSEKEKKKLKEGKKDKSALQVSPAKALVGELDLLETLLNRVVQNYSERLTGEIHSIRSVAYSIAQQPEISQEKIRDIREMLTLLRSLHTKPEKGRRKDLKKIDELIGDLENFTESW